MRRRIILVLVILIFSFTNVFAQENKGSFCVVSASLLHSEGRVEGENYSFNHVGLDFEKNWAKRKIGLSGWSFGYRKEELDKKNFGHFVNFGTFGKFNIGAGIYVKSALKLEWGLPSDRLDHTVFDEDRSYFYVYLIRNSNLPSEVNRGFFFWPVAEVKFGRLFSVFVFEAGLRAGFPEVIVEQYFISRQDIHFEIDKDRVSIPSVIVSLGFKF